MSKQRPSTLTIELSGDFNDDIRALWEMVKNKRPFRPIRTVNDFGRLLLNKGAELVEQEHGED